MLVKRHLYFTPLLYTVSAFYYHLHCNSLLVDCKDKGSISLLGAYFYIHNFWFMMYLTGFFGQKIPLSIWDNSLRKKWLWGFFLLVAMYLLHSFGKHFPISKKYLFFHPHDHFVGLNDSALIFSPAIGPPKEEIGLSRSLVIMRKRMGQIIYWSKDHLFS